MSLPAQAIEPDRHADRSVTFLQELLADAPASFTVRLWNGISLDLGSGPPRFTLVLNHPGALRRMFFPANQLTLGEAYIYNDFDIEGEIENCFPVADYLVNRPLGWAERMRHGSWLLSLPTGERNGESGARLKGRRHRPTRDRCAISYHYDLSNAFYRLWLDQQMVYSCAYFQNPHDPLDQAQEQKLDYVCRKLRLRPGERLLDIGCGWGALILHAVRHYGVQAVGITLSQSQAILAGKRIAAAGLKDRCQVEIKDYREMEGEGQFDKLVSIGMFEHVGREQMPEYLARAYRLLRPGGAFLNHGITESVTRTLPPGPSFIDRYVFPDGELLPISEILRLAETGGFEVRDLESLREHYALTLRCWVQRLEAHRQEAIRLVGETNYRIWRLYMAGSAHAFQVGRQNVHQALLVKTEGASGLPLTRADWYQ